MLFELRHAFRLLFKNPVLTLACLVSLALGIGANSAIFSIVYAALLRPLPYPQADRIVRIAESLAGVPGQEREAAFSMDHFRQWRQECTVFEWMAAYRDQQYTLERDVEPVQLFGIRASPALFKLLGVEAFRGRTLLPQDEQPGKDRVLLLSFTAWRAFFGERDDVIGDKVTLDGIPYTVVGVMPPDFEFPDRTAQFWTPLTLAPAVSGGNVHRVVAFPVVARLKDGVTVEQAEAEGNALLERLRDDDPEARRSRIRLLTLQEQMVGEVRKALWILLAAVSLVLLIACGNVANLLLARLARRRGEMALRAALGASPRRLFGQTLMESLLLAMLGGAAGLALAWLGLRLLVGLGSPGLPRLEEVGLNLPVVLFTLALSLLTGLVFGLAPALKSSGRDLVEELKERASETRGGVPMRSLRRGLAAVQVALAVALLTGGALLGLSFLRLSSVDPGYRAESVYRVPVHLPAYRYAGTASRVAFYDEILERAAAVEGITVAGVANLMPLDRANIMLSFFIEGRPRPVRPEEIPRARFRLVGPGYFQAMGIRLLEGRVFAKSDRSSAPSVTIVNQAFVDRFFPQGKALGARIQLGEIVGVVGNIRHEGLDSEPQPEMYGVYAQAPAFMSSLMARMNLVVRTTLSGQTLSEALRALFRDLDPRLPDFPVESFERRVADSVARPRFYAWILGIFAVSALTLAAAGLYSVIAYSVSHRFHETGVRMALGADRGDILRLILEEALLIALAGIAGGVAASLALTRVLRSLLYETSPTDPAILLGITLVMGATALLASYLPARRATRQNPAAALRCP